MRSVLCDFPLSSMVEKVTHTAYAATAFVAKVYVSAPRDRTVTMCTYSGACRWYRPARQNLCACSTLTMTCLYLHGAGAMRADVRGGLCLFYRAARRELDDNFLFKREWDFNGVNTSIVQSHYQYFASKRYVRAV